MASTDLTLRFFTRNSGRSSGSRSIQPT